MKSEKGVTLLILVVTAVLLIILVTIVANNGANTMKVAEYEVFVSELELIQNKVNVIKIQQKENTVLQDYYNNLGTGIDETTLTPVQIEELEKYINISDTTNRLISGKQLEKIDISNIDDEKRFVINFNQGIVISLDGIRYKGTNYYKLSEVPNGTYEIEYTKKTGEISFDVDFTYESNEKFQFVLSNISFPGYSNKGKVMYQIEGEDFWRDVQGTWNNDKTTFTFNTSRTGIYNIKIEDSDGNVGIKNNINVSQ